MGKVLVTGGLGFLGSHLVDRLVSDGEDVVVVDDLSSSVVPPSRYGGKCRVVAADCGSYVPEPGTEFDFVFHLADIAGPYRIIDYAGDLGPRSVRNLSHVMRLGTPGRTRMLFVSSSEIYGRAGSYPESEPALIYTPYTIRLEYAVAKSLCEISALNYGMCNDLAVNVVRPFNIAGPRQSGAGGFVVPRFFEAALAGRPLTVFGDGSQVRSFTHVLDTVESILAVARSDAHGEIFNSGNPANETTILDLAVRIKEMCASDSDIRCMDPTSIFGEHYAESFDKLPDIEKIGREIGWSPKRSLDDVLGDVLREYGTDRPERPAHGR